MCCRDIEALSQFVTQQVLVFVKTKKLKSLKENNASDNFPKPKKNPTLILILNSACGAVAEDKERLADLKCLLCAPGLDLTACFKGN